MIKFEIDGSPIPQKRHRTGKTWRGRTIHYDPQKIEKQTIQWQLRSQFRGAPLETPIRLDIVFHMPIPESKSGIKKKQMLNGVIAHTTKPDLDNLEKFILDCMNKLIFKDDAQVCEVRKKKVYSDKPGIMITLYPLADSLEGLVYENCAR